MYILLFGNMQNCRVRFDVVVLSCHSEIPATDKTALECVLAVDQERVRLEKLAEELAHSTEDGEGLCCHVLTTTDNRSSRTGAD